MATPRISFNARSTVNQSSGIFSWGDALTFNDVLYNQGNAFHTSSSEFIAPVSGTYVFYFHTRADTSHTAFADMVVNTQTICTSRVDGDHNSGSCQAVVHLEPGDRVWISTPAFHIDHYASHSTSFTGFLLSDDEA